MARIVILGPAHPVRGGGMSTFNERLARALMAAGHQVVIFTFSFQYPSWLFPGKTQWSDAPPPADLDIRVQVHSLNPLNWIRIGRRIRKMRPDMLLIRYWLPLMAPCLGSIAKRVAANGHTRVVAITDNVLPHEKRPGDVWLTRYFLKRCHGFLAMSSSVMDELRQFGIDDTRMALRPHPLYDNYGEAVPMRQARQALGLDMEWPLVLFFGFIREYKGLDLLIRAMDDEAVRKTGARLLVAGEFYTAESPYRQLVAELGLQDKVIWHTHFIPDELVRDYFCAADLVAQPYKSASQSGVTQIAYHFGLPMLVTRVGGLPEMVPHMKAGLVVEAEAAAIGTALAQFFNEQWQERLRQGIKAEKERFSWTGFISGLFEAAGIQKQ